MKAKPKFARLNVSALIPALLLSASLSAAQELPKSDVPQQSQSRGVAIDPSAGPLKPSEVPPSGTQPSQGQLPESPQPAVAPAPAQQRLPQPPAQQATQPLGAAAAEQVKTAGGGASRPAGNAIAPARQHQYRSLLIKLGAVAAAGVAVGTVYGLSRATSSTPPHSTVAVAKQH